MTIVLSRGTGGDGVRAPKPLPHTPCTWDGAGQDRAGDGRGARWSYKAVDPPVPGEGVPKIIGAHARVHSLFLPPPLEKGEVCTSFYTNL